MFKVCKKYIEHHLCNQNKFLHCHILSRHDMAICVVQSSVVNQKSIFSFKSSARHEE